MGTVLGELFYVASLAINLYIWVLVAAAILSWLVAFNIINTQNRAVYMIGDFLHRVTEPALRPIRRLLPDLGGVDISPVVLILILIFAEGVLNGWAARIVS